MARTNKAGLAQRALAMPRPAHILRTVAAALAAIVVSLSPARAANAAELAVLKRAVVAHYAVLVHATYEDALGGVRNLARTVDAFLDVPSADALDRARKAWIQARVPYAQTEAYRFYDGPIEAVEGLINAWPIDENLIDYVEGAPDAGVINQAATFPHITSDLIASLNEKGGEKNITAGFHAIEFLLWGQDLNADGPGQRSYLDYVAGKGTHADRRREYLRLALRLLEQNLAQVLEEWAPGRQDNYRARLIAMPPDAALAFVLQGIGILSGSELAGERLTVAYETKEQEDEHSCFSDNTRSDVFYNVIGIRNVFLGRYAGNGEPIEGPALRDLLMRVNPSLAETLTRQIDASVAAAEAVPAPFDRAILGKDNAPGRVAVKNLIAALRSQADSLAQGGAVLGLKLAF